MRLDFNYVVIDDDLIDPDDNRDLMSLIKKINSLISSKGFIAKPQTYTSKQEFEKSLKQNSLTKKRMDLYLSDNNLGNNAHSLDVHRANDGIEIYLELKKDFVCDFILYTRSSTQEIITRMSDYLIEKQDPGLFSRFTFVSRQKGSEWHDKVLEIIDHILTKREEMNNLRGLFAEKISKMDLHLKKILDRDKNEKFRATICAIPAKYYTKIDWNKLDNLRQMRNALLHSDEKYNQLKDEFEIQYFLEDKNGKITRSLKTISESRCSDYRRWLTETCEEVLSWK